MDIEKEINKCAEPVGHKAFGLICKIVANGLPVGDNNNIIADENLKRELSDLESNAIANISLMIEASARRAILDMIKNPQFLRLIAKEYQSSKNRKAAISLHSRPRKSDKIREAALEIWSSGKYRNKDICAEQEYEHLGKAFKTVRNYLRGAPNPNPWPAKNKKKT
jgi:hypothetical protein